MEIKSDYKPYSFRIFKGMSFSVFISVLGFLLILPAGSFLALMINIPILLFFLLLDLHREKYYITLLIIEEKQVCIEYYRFNVFYSEVINTREFDLIYGGEFGIRASALALIFRKHRKKIVKQYQGGVWTKDKMVELYEYIRKEKLKNINKY
jgi:hypothetical protein